MQKSNQINEIFGGNAERLRVLREGLNECDRDGLRRIIKHIENKKPVLLNGDIAKIVDGECVY